MPWSPSAAFRRGLLLVLLTGVATLLFAQTVLFQRLCGWSSDAQHRLLGPVLDMADVVVVDIDEESIEQLKPEHGAWPYSRDLYARLISHLTSRGAKVFAVDILLAESREGDADLAGVLGENVVVAAASFPRPPLRTERYLQQLARDSLGRAGSPAEIGVKMRGELSVPAVSWPDITLPLDVLVMPGRARVGIISVRPDDDGTLRRIPLFHEAHGYLFPGFSLAAWATKDELARMEVDGDRVRVRDRWFSVSPEGEVRLRYPSEVRHLKVVPFHRVARAPVATEAMQGGDSEWAGKTVFIGSSSILFGDYAHTPMGRVSGLVLSAIVAQSLAEGNTFHPAPRIWSAVLFLFAFVPALIWMLRFEAASLPGFAAAALTTAALIVPTGMLLFHQGGLAPWPQALTAGVFALTFASGYGMLRLRSEQERLAYERLAAQEASRMKGEFLAQMAHELRTPLTAITGFNKINQFDDQLGSAQRRRNNAIIGANCEHLLKLVNDNLDHAKIEAGQLKLVPSAQSVEDLVSEVVSTFGPLVAEKGLVLEARFERPLPPHLWIDAVRVRQVLLNLLGNAVKFTESGRVDVLVRWRDNVLDITVADTGPGIEPGAAETIFEPFQQGDDGAGRRSPGTGLGLSIARRLVRLMGGEISLESWPAQGSRFRFWIPALVTVPTRVEAMVALHPTPSQLSGDVLLAEDDEDIRALMQRELAGLGLQVRAVADGLEAVRACEGRRFDLILMDLEMPTMTGMEALQVLRAGGVTAPVVALTAHALGPETNAALSHGFDAVLTKPIGTEVLASALSTYLSPADRDSAIASALLERKA